MEKSEIKMEDYQYTVAGIHDQLAALMRLGKEISTETNIDRVLHILGDCAKEILDADRCSIFIYDKDKNELWTKVAHGIKEIRIPATKGVAAAAATTQETQIVIDAYHDFRFNQEIDDKSGYLTKTILAAPLINTKGETIGVFQAINKKGGVFSNVDAELLMLIGNYASVSLENALLYEKIKKSQMKLINKIATAAEFKDEDTSKHTKRVGLYSYLIAKRANLVPQRCEMIKITAPMHDAGKIGIPDRILLKPAKLDKDEFDEMKKHTNIGYELLYDEDDEMLKNAAIIAREHHEKWDGSGYPRGLKGEEITLEGRITAIADVFDALTSVRPYKRAWSVEEAKELFIKESGTHFDPKLVELFLKNFDEVETIYEELKD